MRAAAPGRSLGWIGPFGLDPSWGGTRGPEEGDTVTIYNDCFAAMGGDADALARIKATGRRAETLGDICRVAQAEFALMSPEERANDCAANEAALDALAGR